MDPIFGGNRGQGCHTQGRTTDRNPHSTSSCKNRTRSSKKGYKIKSEKIKSPILAFLVKKINRDTLKIFQFFLLRKKERNENKAFRKNWPAPKGSYFFSEKNSRGLQKQRCHTEKNLFSVTMHTSSRRSKKNCSTQKHSSRTTKN